MNNFHFGYSHNAINKQIKGDISLGWNSKVGTVDDLASHVKKGLPVCHSTFTGQKRADAHFNFADICLVDIDNSTVLKGNDGKPVKGNDGKAIKIYKEELTIGQMMEHEFIKSHCFYSYTSASHKPDHHKYRLAFRLPNRITDPKLFKAVLLELRNLIPAIDRAAISVTNIYFGNDKAIDLIVNPDALPISQDFIDRAIATQAALEAEKQALKANREAWKANYADCDNDRLEREIYRALEYIPPRIEGGGTYDTSIRVCWALASHFGESKAIAIMESHSPNHGAWDVAKVVSQSHKYPDVGLGSLFHFAKENGYRHLELTKEEKKAWFDSLTDDQKQAWLEKKRIDNPEQFDEELKAKKQDDLLFLNWQKNKAYTPDTRVNNQAVFDTIPIPNVNSIVAVRSDFGTQKTRGMLPNLKHWHKQGYKVILAGFRNALLMQTINVWSEVLPNLMMMKLDPTYIRMAGQHIALCLDQLTRNKCKPQDFDKSILVIDEADQVEMHLLMGGTLKDNRSEVFALYCEMIKRADVIYLMSAGLSDATVKFIQDIRGDRFTKVIKYQNDFVNRQKFTIVDDVVNPHTGAVTSSRSILKTKISGFKGNAFVANDSQNDLEAIEKNRKIQYAPIGGKLADSTLKTFRYDSKTSDSEAGRDFAANPNQIEGDLYISPSANCGISITKENHFGAVFAISNGVLDVDSFLQMPMRVRDKSVARYLAVPKTCEGFSDRLKPKMPSEVMALHNEFWDDFGNLSIKGLPTQEKLEEHLQQYKDTLLLNALQFRRYAELQAALNYEKANFKKCLEWRLNDLGHSFKRLENGFSDSNVIKEIIEIKDRIEFKECQKIIDSPDISISEAKAIMQSDKPYEERLKATKAIIKDNLPRIEKSELWSADFIKLTRYDDRDLLKRLDLRYLANNPDVAQSKAVDNLAYLMQLQDVISLQDVRSPLPFLTAAREVGLIDLMSYQGDDLHKDHDQIISICKAAKKKANARRLGIFQGKKESNMQFISRLLAKLGYGTKSRYIKVDKTYFYQVKDKARAAIEMFQVDRGAALLGAALRDLPSHLYQKCFDDKGKQTIFTFAEFCDEFGGLEPMLKICYGKAKNINQLALIDMQLQLIFASADEAFLELSEAVNTRYRHYQNNKKQHDFEAILEQKNSMIETPETVDTYREKQDHPLPISINKIQGEGDPVFGYQAIALIAPQIDPYELRLMALQSGWDGSPFSLMRYAY